MTAFRKRVTRLVPVAAVVGVVPWAPAVASAEVVSPGAGPATSPVVSLGAAGLGDRLFPALGNGGYEVDHYDLELSYEPRTRRVHAVTRIRATATQALSRFDLDFDAGPVSVVQVDGAPARFGRHAAELVVSPARPVRAGAVFTVQVEYTADPAAATACRIPDIPADSAWFPTTDGFFTAAQPGCAHTVFPSNDHPSDPASYSFAITVPSGLTAVANGVAAGSSRHGDTITWRFEQREPMASELVQIVVGRYRVIRGTGPHGLPLRSVVVAGKEKASRRAVASVGAQIRWMERRVGRYPFATYGILGVPRFPSALETQTLSVFDIADLTAGSDRWAPLAMHELSHQWFGDSVIPGTWSDLWLNEGHATWYEYTYAEEHGGPTLEQLMKQAYRQSNRWRRSYGPPARPARAGTMFSPNVYDGGALALYALRQEVGTRRFERIERAWATEYRGRPARTSDYVDLAGRIAGRDLHSYLDPWLFGRTVPAMAGHPDWHPLR